MISARLSPVKWETSITSAAFCKDRPDVRAIQRTVQTYRYYIPVLVKKFVSNSSCWAGSYLQKGQSSKCYLRWNL